MPKLGSKQLACHVTALRPRNSLGVNESLASLRSFTRIVPHKFCAGRSPVMSQKGSARTTPSRFVPLALNRLSNPGGFPGYCEAIVMTWRSDLKHDAKLDEICTGNVPGVIAPAGD